jgi:hypothetical protein
MKGLEDRDEVPRILLLDIHVRQFFHNNRDHDAKWSTFDISEDSEAHNAIHLNSALRQAAGSNRLLVIDNLQ